MYALARGQVRLIGAKVGKRIEKGNGEAAYSSILKTEVCSSIKYGIISNESYNKHLLSN
jgi:hypothetical protein